LSSLRRRSVVLEGLENIYFWDYADKKEITGNVKNLLMLMDQVRRAWDLVPEPQSVMDHTQSLKDKGKFHA